MKTQKVLIIIPAYNEQDNIRKLLNSLKKNQYNIQCAVDIIIINDKSEDETSRISRDMGVKVIDLPCNLGIGGAVQTGYKYALNHQYDIAIQVDGDGQHNPGFINHLLEPILNNDVDLVIGSRYINKVGFQSTKMRRIGIFYFSKLIKVLTTKVITDPTSGFRASNKKVIKLFADCYPTDYPEPESIVFLLRQGLNVVEVPVVMEERLGGTSSIKSLKSIYYMIKVSLAILIDRLRKRVDFY